MSNELDIDVNGLSLSELDAHIEALKAAKEKRLAAERADKIREVRTAVVTYELNIEDIFPDFYNHLEELNKSKSTFDLNDILKLIGTTVVYNKKPRAKRGTAQPRKVKGEAKYRNPDNPEMTWSGQGRKPAWLSTYLANRGKLEDLLIAAETQEGE